MATLILNPETSEARFVQLDKTSMLIGSASDADIQLEDESLSARHARIEHKQDGYYIIGLNSPSGVLVNGDNISFQRLQHGDKIELGDIKAILLLTDEDASTHEKPVQEFMPITVQGTSVLSPMSHGPTICPQCGYPLSPGMPACPRCGLPLTNLPAIPMGFIPPVPPSQVGPGILPIIAFLAALTVVGAPVALVLGLMTLSIIRRRGGTIRDRSLAKWSIGLGLVWLMLGAVAAGGIVRKIQNHKQLNAMKASETQVIHALKNLACAQKYAHTIEAYDVDSDGQGEYGDLPVLAKTASPFFDANLADGEAYGYRFAIREASESQFLAIAEPVRYGETGIRTFAINQSGQIRGGDTNGQDFGQTASKLPVLQGERNAYYEIDDEIAKDVLNYVKSLPPILANQEKIQRVLERLRKDYALTTVGRELDGMETSVDRFVTEQHAQAIYREAQTALTKENNDVALAKLQEIQKQHPDFSKIAAVERNLSDLRSMIAQQREQNAQDLFAQAEEVERQGKQPLEVQRLYQRIEKLYPDSDVAARIASLKPELQRQLRERNAETIFSDLMELSPEHNFEEILNRANQLRRNYKDTDLFSKVESELAEKERKARASSWRAKTEQNMAAGRMRGALAQLESAARENPDLLYDLRDLCIPLYRSVANTLIQEGDARKALIYYERLSRLFQADGSGEQVAPELLAKLHNDVGQTDFGLKAYKEARWHFASAAWKYKDDAPFNMRLGAANLYTGLYRPAETALTRALSIRPNMTSALLYRAYLNLRVALTEERVLAGGFKQDEMQDDGHVNDETNAPLPAPNSLIVSVDDTTDNEDDDVVINANVTAGSTSVAPAEHLDVKSSTAEGSWFSKFAENKEENGSPVPEPTDLNLFLNFDYSSSSTILPGILQFLQELQLQRDKRTMAKSTARAQAAAQNAGRSDLRKMGKMALHVSEQKNIAEYHTQLRQLRSLHLKDEAARKELSDRMEEMKKHIRSATTDIQTAGEQQPRIQSLTESVLAQINKKYEFLHNAEKLISSCMKEEVDLRERMLELAEKMLLKNGSASFSTSTSFEKDLARFRNKLFEQDSVIQLDQALRSLRNSMDVRVDLNDILRAASGDTQIATEK